MKKWPYLAAGLCVWDTLAPPSSALVAHDGSADAPPSMPNEYTCLTWAQGQQRILCGTKTGELRVFDLRQQRIAQRVEAHTAAMRHCFLLESEGKIATFSAAAELKIWSLKSLECLETRS